jgi:hypothetical protein
LHLIERIIRKHHILGLYVAMRDLSIVEIGHCIDNTFDDLARTGFGELCVAGDPIIEITPLA